MAPRLRLATIAVVASAVLASGCATYRQSRSTAKGGGYTMLAGAGLTILGVGMVFSADGGEDCEELFGCGDGIPGLMVGALGVGVLVIGALIGLGGISGMAIHEKPERDDDDARFPSPATEQGYLTISADSIVAVWVDGEDWGATPIYRRKLTVGRHVIEARDPDTGELLERREIVIKSDAPERIYL